MILFNFRRMKRNHKITTTKKRPRNGVRAAIGWSISRLAGAVWALRLGRSKDSRHCGQAWTVPLAWN